MWRWSVAAVVVKRLTVVVMEGVRVAMDVVLVVAVMMGVRW